MWTKVLIKDNYVNFETLVSIVNLSFARIAISKKKSNLSDDIEFSLRGIDFIQVAIATVGVVSDVFYEIRPTSEWEKRIIEFVNSGVEEFRPDGEYWAEEYSGSYKGDPTCKYYALSSLKELLNTALFCRGSVLEYTYDKTKLVLFSMEELKTSESYNYVSILMTEYEYERERQREKEEHERLEDSGDPDPDSWMDNPEDYWNID
jgi:hypothetical protein